MTPGEALKAHRLRPGDSREEWLSRWHSQPHCGSCRDYLVQHENEPPHPCRFPDCRCKGFDYENQWVGDWAEERESYGFGA